MQEKVTFRPPEIKLFEGKTPPTSWFTENVVRYFQVKSQAEFLTNFLAYTKQLQSVKISKAIPHAVEKEPESVQIPEGANPEEISKILLFNTLQENIKTEIESLEKLIVILQQANPGLVKELNTLLVQIKTLAKAFPALEEEQTEFLTKTAKQLEEFVGKLPLGAQRKFWEKQFNMLYEIWENLDQFIKNCGNELNALKQHTTNLQEMQSTLQTLGSLISKKGSAPFANEELQQILAFLLSVMKGHSNLTDKELSSLRVFLQKLSQIKGTNGKPMTGLNGDAILKQWIDDFVQSHPNASATELKQYIQNLLDESDLSKTSLPFLNEVSQGIRQSIQSPKFPFTPGITGAIFAKDQSGKIILNENFHKELEKMFTLDPNSAKEALVSKNDVVNHVNVALQRNQNLSEGIASARSEGERMKASFGGAGATAAGNSGLSGSLPNEFRQAILGHYMPMQEAYLMQLAELLYFANFGAEMGNTILNKIMDFGEAANNYDFSNFLHSDSSGNFTGNPTDAQNELQNEQNQVSTDLHKISDTLNWIHSEIGRINNNSQLSQSQKNQMISQLNGYASNLNAAYGQLENVKAVVDNISVVPAGSNNFTIGGVGGNPPPANWQTNLNTYERIAVNGDPSGVPQGGLLNIESSVTADQQTYSDQSQNQQMMLQMRMTEIQQEWTVVSDSLQALNQMYMTCAQAIYK